MIEIIHVPSKKTRTFGWVQDASNVESLYNVVSVFDRESNFHKAMVEEIIPALIIDEDMKIAMLEALKVEPLSIKYKLLVGTRSEHCTGIIQAAVKGQKRPFIVDWAADSFVRWALTLNLISYDYKDDSFSITELGKKLTNSDEKHRDEIFVQIFLSYPPAYRILTLLSDPDNSLTKYELSEKIGFTGEDGFICYPIKSVVAALSEARTKNELSEIRSNWESTADKYARMIANWLKKLGLVETCNKDLTVTYGKKIASATLSAFCITPKGERVLRNIQGNSRHQKIVKNIRYEMFASKGSDREYLRLRRSLILKAIVEGKNKVTFAKIQEALKANGLEESLETIKDDISGFVNLGLNIEIGADSVILNDTIADFMIPVYKDLTVKSELSKEKDEVRKQLKTLSHDYLSLMDLAFDSKQSQLFEIKAMDLFLNECGFYGRHLGGANKPDGILYTEKNYSILSGKENYGIIVDMKAYSGGYNLPIGQQDEMKRYISNNQKRDEKINPTKWWREFPDYLKKYYFMFVSGTFKGDMTEKLNKIYLETKVSGTAMPIVTALLVADKIKSKEMTLQDFENGICNTEYRS